MCTCTIYAILCRLAILWSPFQLRVALERCLQTRRACGRSLVGYWLAWHRLMARGKAGLTDFDVLHSGLSQQVSILNRNSAAQFEKMHRLELGTAQTGKASKHPGIRVAQKIRQNGPVATKFQTFEQVWRPVLQKIRQRRREHFAALAQVGAPRTARVARK